MLSPSLRSATPLVLTAILCSAAALHAAPTSPPVDGATSEPVIFLRAPRSAEVLVRSGTFTMGSTEDEIRAAIADCQREPRRDDCKDEWFAAEQPAHKVFLSDYWIDRTEVTVARYRQCVTAGTCALPPFAEGGERFDRPDFPVVLVTWNDAQRFCAWAGGRLPTEAEWERAARGPSDADIERGRGTLGRRYPWGNVYNPFLSNHGAFSIDDLDARDGFLELAPVGSYPDGRTPDGLDDLAGNAEEWVADWFAPEYPRADAMNPKGPDMGDRRVVRGGGYHHARAWLRGASRENMAPGERTPWVGFRCARDVR